MSFFLLQLLLLVGWKDYQTTYLPLLYECLRHAENNGAGST